MTRNTKNGGSVNVVKPPAPPKVPIGATALPKAPQPAKRLSGLMPQGLLDAAFQYGARRRSRRWPVEGEVTFVAPHSVGAQLINASSGGLAVAVDSPISVGELCVVRVRTTEGQETQEHARVVWSKAQGGLWAIGLRFELSKRSS
jgi:hypothetical protein